MSYSLDVNILLYASNAQSPEHSRAARFLSECADRPEILCLAWPTIVSYLRISTHPRIFPSPLSSQHAMRNVEALLDLHQTRMIGELEGFWRVYRELCGIAPSHGNQVPDTHLAAILKQNGVTTLYTNDLDFKRYDFLEVRNPLAG